MSTIEHRVQGLNNDQVAADWPAISPGEITALQAHFPALRGACTVRWHSPRPMSAAAIIDTGNGPVFLKRHHRSVRDAVTLGEEHRFIAHLAATGVPVVQLLAGHGGATAIEHGQWTYELHALAAGDDRYRDLPSWVPPASVDDAHAAGVMLARLHDAAASYHAPQRSTHMLVARDELIRSADPIATLQQQLAGRPALAAWLAGKRWQQQLQQHLLPWHAALGQRLAQQPRLWAHNDWHVSNLLWRGSGAASEVACVFDFGLASPTSALFDLATAIERNAVAWLQLAHGERAVRGDIALALLAGYRQQRPLDAAQVHLLADLLPVVHVDFALSEVEYFHAATGSPANAEIAWHDFLLGHAQWFHSAAGRRLLDTLRAAG